MTNKLLSNFKELENSNSVIVKYKNETLSGHQLFLMSSVIANNLMVYKNRYIFYLGGKNINLLPVAYGIMLSGNIYTPINNKDGIRRLSRVINSVKDPIVIVDNKAFIPKLGGVKALILSDLIKGDAAFTPHLSNKNDIAYTIFTSGSTGFPKGVNIQYKSLEELVFWYSSYLELNNQSKTSLIAKPHFDLSIPDIFAPLIYKGTLNIIPDQVIMFPASLAEYLDKNDIDYISLVPTLFTKISELLCKNSKQLKGILLIGEKFPYNQACNLSKKLGNTKIYNMYGPTEGCFCSSSHIFNNKKDCINVPIGLPRSGNRYKIVNSQLHIGGDCISSGYLNYKSDSFYEEDGVRWYKTGDIVEYKSGNYFFIDRLDRQVQINGYRVELSEIESVLEMELCYRVGVIYSDKLICFIETGSNDNIGVNLIKEYQRESLPAYMRVTEFFFIKEMPQNSSGKIDYNKLSEMYKNEQ